MADPSILTALDIYGQPQEQQAARTAAKIAALKDLQLSGLLGISSISKGVSEMSRAALETARSQESETQGMASSVLGKTLEQQRAQRAMDIQEKGQQLQLAIEARRAYYEGENLKLGQRKQGFEEELAGRVPQKDVEQASAHAAGVEAIDRVVASYKAAGLNPRAQLAHEKVRQAEAGVVAQALDRRPEDVIGALPSWKDAVTGTDPMAGATALRTEALAKAKASVAGLQQKYGDAAVQQIFKEHPSVFAPTPSMPKVPLRYKDGKTYQLAPEKAKIVLETPNSGWSKP